MEQSKRNGLLAAGLVSVFGVATAGAGTGFLAEVVTHFNQLAASSSTPHVLFSVFGLALMTGIGIAIAHDAGRAFGRNLG
jgi:hypothetical protein